MAMRKNHAAHQVSGSRTRRAQTKKMHAGCWRFARDTAASIGRGVLPGKEANCRPTTWWATRPNVLLPLGNPSGRNRSAMPGPHDQNSIHLS